MNLAAPALPAAAPAAQARAFLNILEDLTGEKARMHDVHRAVINILGDFSDESERTRAAQKAMLNVLTDFGEERSRLVLAQRAVLNILEDVGDEERGRRQRTAELAGATQQMEAFVYATSHELRTPLRAIEGFAHVLMEDRAAQLGAEGLDELRRVRDAARHMAGLIDRMQRLARIGSCSLHSVPVDLAAMAAAIGAQLHGTAPDRDVRLVIEPGLAARGDPEMLGVVLASLLDNAWKFTRTRRRARIEIGGRSEGGEDIFFVRDDGVGFDMAHAGKLFAPFERLHGPAFEGSGVGLAMVRRIVQRHGGRTWAEGVPGQGATFWFALPAAGPVPQPGLEGGLPAVALPAVSPGWPLSGASPRSQSRAILNILEDLTSEKVHWHQAQRATLNLLDDAMADRDRLAGAQRAVLNILEDASGERSRVAATQKALLNILADGGEEVARTRGAQSAMLNVLEDAMADRGSLVATQRAVLNILADGSEEVARTRGAQSAMLNVLDDAMADRGRLVATQRAVLNILADGSEEVARTRGAQSAMLNVLVDFDAERDRLRLSQRAALNLLEDFDQERRLRERAESEVRALNGALEARIVERTAELTSANQELEAFVYAASHELRTPLRAVDGFAHALISDYQDRLDDEGRDDLHRVRDAAQRMGEMIDRMQRLARIGTCALEERELDLSALAQAEDARLRAAAPGRDVRCRIAPGMRARGDAELVQILLHNLMANAWKFTGSLPSANIEVGTLVHEGQPVFFVSDDGVGFDMAHAARLFAPFERLHRSGEFAGIGMGLASVRRIALRHGGRAWAEGTPGRGATFYFTLPRGAPQGGARGATPRN